MTGDEDGVQPKPDPVPEGPLTQAAPSAGEAASSFEEHVAAGPTAADDPPERNARFGTPSTGTLAEPQAAEPVSLRPLWLALIAGFVILAGGLLYLFSLLPDTTRLSAAEKATDELRTEMAAVQAKVSAPPDTGALTRRLDAADRSIADLKAQIEAVRAQAAKPAQAPAAAAPDLGPLAAKVAALETGLGSLRSGLPDDIKQATAGIDERLKAVSAKVDGLPKVDLGPLTARLDTLEQRLKPIEDEYRASKSPQRVTDVRQNGSAAETRAAPLAVTAEAVQRAIDAGRPFGDDLKVMARLGAPAGSLEPLRAVADTGAPTIKDLRADLAALREKVTTRAAPAPTGSYLDRLMAGAATVVQVRPLGSVVGDTPPAILARMDDDLARDDLAAVAAEWQKLPAEDRALGKSFAERLRLRQAAEDAARSIGAQAIQAMASDQP